MNFIEAEQQLKYQKTNAKQMLLQLCFDCKQHKKRSKQNHNESTQLFKSPFRPFLILFSNLTPQTKTNPDSAVIGTS